MEQLLASRSVWGTIESQLQLHTFSIVGAHLLLLWSLSPLGGQASLRALGRMDRVTQNTTTLRHLYTGPFSAFMKPRDRVCHVSGDVYYSALTASLEMRTAPRNNWGNVRVPQQDAALLANRSCRSNDGWTPVPPITQPGVVRVAC